MHGRWEGVYGGERVADITVRETVCWLTGVGVRLYAWGCSLGDTGAWGQNRVPLCAVPSAGCCCFLSGFQHREQ